MNDFKGINKTSIMLGYALATIASVVAVIILGSIFDSWLSYLMAIAMVIGAFVGVMKTDFNRLNYALMVSDSGTFSAVTFGLSEGLAGMGVVLLLASMFLFPLMLYYFFVDFWAIIDGTLIIIAGFIVFVAVFLVYCLVIRAIAQAALTTTVMKEKAEYERETSRCLCPECGSVFPRPVYACSCGQRYPDGSNPELKPSIRGVNHTSCSSCGAMLPVTNAKGERGRLDAFCPECDAPIRTMEAFPYIISLAGPVASGKSTLAFSAIRAAETKAGATRPYVQKLDMQTSEAYSPPYIVGMPSDKKHGCFLAIFDISGKYFSGTQSVVGAQPQYGQEDAIVFVVDPTARNSVTMAEAAVNDFWQTYHAVSQTSLTEAIPAPLHLVATHRDAIGDQKDVREFLMNAGFAHVVSSLESNFKEVRYHICDARRDHEAAAVFGELFSSRDRTVSDAFSKI